MTPDAFFDRLVVTALDRAFEHVRRTIPKMGMERPRMGLANLTYERCGLNDWVDSFWPGQLWLAYESTRDEVFRQAAEGYRSYFAGRLHRREGYTHDFGFLYSLSAVAEWRITRNPAAREMALRAAEILAGRYHAKGGYIQAWNDESLNEIDAVTNANSPNSGKMIIDCMMNIPLLYWAAGETGNEEFSDIANSHADTTVQVLVRPDFSTIHTFRFDPATGEPLGGKTFQGFADDSCWSRGHSWAVHGFTQAVRYTGRACFLRIATGLADYALAHLPADGVPVWDFLIDDGSLPYRDSSAAAILASGLADLAGQMADRERATRYWGVSERILRTLIDDYSLIDNREAEGLLRGGASFVAMGLRDTMLPYGDYFFLEALLRHRGRGEFYW